MSLTICFITSREHHEFNWFIDSLTNQMNEGECIDIIFVNLRCKKSQCWVNNPSWSNAKKVSLNIIETPPKPNIWQGEHRITKEDWWAASASRNTALCLCLTNYIVWLDDRSVLLPGWLEGIKRAAKDGYAVCGTYEKRHGMVAEGGRIIDHGILDGWDGRADDKGIRDCHGQFWGGTMGCPTEWALRVNGFEEMVDGLGAEDYLFGMMLNNAGCRTMFDPSIAIVQDRTPGLTGTPMKKTDKGISPNDKSHAALERFGKPSRAEHVWNLREIRNQILSGGSWPGVESFPKTDWWDGQRVVEMG